MTETLNPTRCRARPALLLTVLFTLWGCAGNPSAPEQEAPKVDPEVTGAVALTATRGSGAERLSGSVERAFLTQFPRGRWLVGVPREADLLLDLTVHDAKLQEKPYQNENRRCSQFSEPSPGAKTVLEKALSRKCLSYTTDVERCVLRTYEIDLQVRGLQRSGQLVASDRRVLSGEQRSCGDKSPPSTALRSEVENRAGPWVMGVVGPALRKLTFAAGQAVVLPPAAMPSSIPAAAAAGAVAGTAAAGVTRAPGPAPSPPAQVRLRAHALVIGNEAYAGTAALANPVRDARAMAERLAALGFRVTRVENADRPALVRALSQFRAAAASAELTVLFYAGHGVQLDGTNYMLPTDIAPSDPGALRLQAVPIDSIIEQYLPGQTRIVFLDACRDNPFSAQATRGRSRGLAPMSAPEGTLIAFAAKDGGTAEDGMAQSHSPFTAALLEHLGDPEDIVIVLRKVRQRVMQATAGRQQPWDYGSLTGGALVLSTVARTSP